MQGLITFFKGYRDTGVTTAVEIAREIALEIDIDPAFRKKREIKRKKHFDENPDDVLDASQSAQESFRIKYFLLVVDQAIASLTTRFEQYKSYEKTFGFLFTSHALNSLDDTNLRSSCSSLETALRSGDKSDIDGNDLYVELKLLQDFIPKEKSYGTY